MAMAMRALVPAGYMLSPSVHGSSIIVLCSGHAMASMPGMDHGGKPDHSSSHRDAPCAFSAVAHLATPETPPSIVTAFTLAADAPPAPLYVTPGRGLAAPPPWATGPPTAI